MVILFQGQHDFADIFGTAQNSVSRLNFRNREDCVNVADEFPLGEKRPEFFLQGVHDVGLFLGGAAAERTADQTDAFAGY